MKIGISGAPAIGKTFFINNCLPKNVLPIRESARSVADLNPNIGVYKLRELIFNHHLRTELLSEAIAMDDKTIVATVYDRTIIDNIVFLNILESTKLTEIRKNMVKDIYLNGELKKYDFILYFDYTRDYDASFLGQVLSDELRVKTLGKWVKNAENFFELTDAFKEKFMSTAKEFGIKVINVVSDFDIHSLNQRNEYLKTFYFNSSQKTYPIQ